MAGILAVDFAGTTSEADEYAAANTTPGVRLRVGNKPHVTPEGSPMLTVYYTNRAGRKAAVVRLAELGWGDGEFLERVSGAKQPRR
jgi:hypothetical protein